MFRGLILYTVVALGIPDLLLSCSVIIVALHTTIILIMTHTSFNHTPNQLTQTQVSPRSPSRPGSGSGNGRNGRTSPRSSQAAKAAQFNRTGGFNLTTDDDFIDFDLNKVGNETLINHTNHINELNQVHIGYHLVDEDHGHGRAHDHTDSKNHKSRSPQPVARSVNASHGIAGIINSGSGSPELASNPKSPATGTGMGHRSKARRTMMSPQQYSDKNTSRNKNNSSNINAANTLTNSSQKSISPASTGSPRITNINNSAKKLVPSSPSSPRTLNAFAGAKDTMYGTGGNNYNNYNSNLVEQTQAHMTPPSGRIRAQSAGSSRDYYNYQDRDNRDNRPWSGDSRSSAGSGRRPRSGGSGRRKSVEVRTTASRDENLRGGGQQLVKIRAALFDLKQMARASPMSLF